MRERLVPCDWTSMKPLDSMVMLPPSPKVPVTPLATIREPGSRVTLPARMVSGAVPVPTSSSLPLMTSARPPRSKVEPAGTVHAAVISHGLAAGAQSCVALHCADADPAPTAITSSAASALTTTEPLRTSIPTPTGAGAVRAAPASQDTGWRASDNRSAGTMESRIWRTRGECGALRCSQPGSTARSIFASEVGMMMRRAIRFVLPALLGAVVPAAAGVVAPAPSALPDYLLFAQRRIESNVSRPTFHGSVGVNCPFTAGACGIAAFARARFADHTAVVAARVVPRLADSSMFRVFGTLDDPGAVLEIRDPAPTPDGAHPFAPPLLGDLDGDGAPSCAADCTTDPGDLERACGFAQPFPTCDVALRVIARRNRDCSVGDMVPGNARCDLAPGVYGEVTVRGKAVMVLAAGTYTMCSLDVGKRGELVSTAPALVNVDGGVVKVKRRGALGRVTGQIAVHKKGVGQVRIDPLGYVTSRICAPEATISLGRRNRPAPVLFGQFVGDVITVEGDFGDGGGDPEIDGPDTCAGDADCNGDDVCGARSCVACSGCDGEYVAECCNHTGGNYCSDLIPQPCHCDTEGASCDDGDACTVADACDGGLVCAGTETLVCDDDNLCTDDGCDPETGCTATPNTASCDDGNACTADDTCADGACAPGTTIECDDGIACTIDTCDPDEGCVHTPFDCACDEDADCEDGNPCTETSCDQETSTCESTPVACACEDDADCEDGDPCTETSCDTTTNTCESTPVACVCAADADCEDDDPCTVNSCVGDVCQSAPAPNGTSCADADPCDGAETCTAGVCGGGTPLVCDDGNPCTTDACTAGVGCTTTNADGATCSDGDACNGDELCSGGACVPGAPPVCFAAMSCAFAAPLTLGQCPEKMKTRFERARTLGEAGRGRALDGKDRAAGKRLRKSFRILRKMAKRAGLLEACAAVTARAETARDAVGGIRSNFDACVADLRNAQ